MTERELPNIYILLNLDPSQLWNRADLEKQIESKRREWGRLVNRPDKKGFEAKKNLELISELKRIAADETLCRQQAEEAVEESLRNQTEQIQKLDDDIRLKGANGFILQAEFENLLERYKAIITEADLRKRINVPIREQTSILPISLQNALDSVTAKNINDLLNSLKKTDLYDFLGLDESASTESLREVVRILYDKTSKKGTKTAVDTVTIQLCGHCMRIFKDNQERTRYTETIRQASYEDLKARMDVAAEVSKTITREQLEQILIEARQRKLDQDEAIEVIQDYVKLKKYALFSTDELLEAVRKMQQCGYCKQMNEAGNKHCVQCGKPMQEACPGCGKAVASDDSACSNCGFIVGDRSYVNYLLDETDFAVSERDFDLAARFLNQARAAWPAKTEDALLQRISSLEGLVEEKRKLVEDTISVIRESIDKKQFYQASSKLLELKDMVSGENTTYQEISQLVEYEIIKTDKQITEARALSEKGIIEEAILAYQEALSISIDCQEAREMLKRMPPDPPQGLQAITVGGIVQLTWIASRSKLVRYTVIRKEGLRPLSSDDGTVLDTIGGLTYDDTQCEPGISYFYGVYSGRVNIVSENGDVLADPVLVTQEVEKLTALVNDGQVHLQWNCPANVADVIVVRSENGYPKSIREGLKVSLLDKNHAIDSRLQNNRTYFYTVFTQYHGLSETLITSAGVHIDAVPQIPPDPVKELKLTFYGHSGARKVHLHWAFPQKGQVIILKSGKSTALQSGMVIPSNELTNYGQLLLPQGNHMIDDVDLAGYIYYLPVVIFKQSAYIGNETPFVNVDEVRDLTVQNLGFALRLHWRWPENCNEVLIAIRFSGWPERKLADIFIPLTRAQYQNKGYYDLENPPLKDHYITVFAMYILSDEKVVSAGTRKLVHLDSRILLEYEVRFSRFGKKMILEIRTSGKGLLPVLLLVSKRNSLPLHLHDGDIIQRFEARTLSKENERIQIVLDPSVKSTQSYGRLFLEDERLYDRVTIRQPEKEKLRLF